MYIKTCEKESRNELSQMFERDKSFNLNLLWTFKLAWWFINFSG